MIANFDQILGQDSAVGQLRSAVAAERLPHGLIFAGPRGVGKGTTAAALGALLLCEKPMGDRPCGRCESCRVMEAGNHPDFHVVSKEMIRYHDKTGKSKGIDLSIAVIRPEVIEKASRKAAMGRAKVFVIEQADLMSAAAQNALLKTLEEPRGPTVIVLLSEQAEWLLPTIRSRCQLVRFGNLDEALVKRELEKRGVSAAVAAEVGEFGLGSLGQALSWINDGLIEPAAQLTARLDAIFAGKGPGDLPDWFKSAGEAYAQRELQRDELGSKDQAIRHGLGLLLRVAAEHVRRELLEQNALRSCAAIEAIAQAEGNLDSNVNQLLVFEQLASALSR